MNTSREYRRNIWHEYHEVWLAHHSPSSSTDHIDAAPHHNPDSGDQWYEHAMAFFAEAMDDRRQLEQLYLSPIEETRRAYTKAEKRMVRCFWGRINKLGLDEYGQLIREMRRR